MAELVMGLGTSHSPQLSTPVSTWSDHAARDRANGRLLGTDGEYHSYDDLLAAADPAVSAELGTEIWEEKYERCQAAIAELARRLEAAHPDVVVVIGDDQEELFDEEGTSTFSLFLGGQLADLAPSAAARARMPFGLQEALWAAHAPDGDVYPSQPALSLHLVEQLIARDFDVSRFSRQHEGRSLGHAFTFVRRRLGLAGDVPIVPVFVNTYYPPNVPSAARCYAFGGALAEAIASWPEEARGGGRGERGAQPLRDQRGARPARARGARPPRRRRPGGDRAQAPPLGHLGDPELGGGGRRVSWARHGGGRLRCWLPLAGRDRHRDVLQRLVLTPRPPLATRHRAQ